VNIVANSLRVTRTGSCRIAYFILAHKLKQRQRVSLIASPSASISAALSARRVRGQRASSLFDHLIGAGQDRLRHRQTERLRGLQIDHQLECRRLLYREVGGSGTV
jgi:hypothetical protein